MTPRVVTAHIDYMGVREEMRFPDPRPGPPPWTAQDVLHVIGQPHPRIDGPEIVTGQALYTGDVLPPDVLCAHILRCPFPHATIARLEVERARKVPGVAAILTPEDVAGMPGPEGGALLGGVMQYPGAEVAVVAAESEWIAEAAAAAIEVEYTRLPAVLDPEEALGVDAPQLVEEGNLPGRPEVYLRGNPDQALAEAPVIISGTFTTATAPHSSLEPHTTVAVWDQERLIIHESTQGIFATRRALAELLGLPVNRVRVICHFAGGAFGNKRTLGTQTVLAALLAQRTGRPVRLSLSRAEEQLVGGYRCPTVQHLRAGFTTDGTLVGAALRSIAGAGAAAPERFGDCGGPLRALYTCPHVFTEERLVRVNLPPRAASRGAGSLPGTFALEQLIDRAAAQLGLDPLELRRRNLAERDQVLDRPFAACRLREALDLGAAAIRWERRADLTELNTLSPRHRRGLGMAVALWPAATTLPAAAVVEVHPDGTVAVSVGTQETGGGIRTAIAQIVAEELGLPIGAVTVVIGDTESLPPSAACETSGTVLSVGGAVRAAAHEVRRQLLAWAAPRLDACPEELILAAGAVRRGDTPEHALTLAAIMEQTDGTPIIGAGDRGPLPEHQTVIAAAAHFAEVEIDTAAGDLRVARVVAVHDAGRIINPLTARSLVEGAVVQGVAAALGTQWILDPGLGTVVSTQLTTAAPVRASDAPVIDVQFLPGDDPAAPPLGAKGLTDPAAIPTAAAIANAVFHALGRPVHRLPLTRAEVLHIMGTADRRR